MVTISDRFSCVVMLFLGKIYFVVEFCNNIQNFILQALLCSVQVCVC